MEVLTRTRGRCAECRTADPPWQWRGALRSVPPAPLASTTGVLNDARTWHPPALPPTKLSAAQLRAAEHGLYDPSYEHDACGVAFVATLSGVPSHTIVAQGLEALRNLDHRGATGADPRTGDGAGILLQVPDALPA